MIEKHREVVKFTCGLMSDPRPLVDHVYTAFIEHVLEKMRSESDKPYIDTSLLESLYRESTVPLPGSAQHNQYINFYCHAYNDHSKRHRDMTPVLTPSKLYVFWEMKEDVTLEHRTTETGAITDPGQSAPNSDSQECAIWIKEPDKSLTEKLLSLSETISASQLVTDFFFWNKETTVSIDRNPGKNNSNSQKCSLSIKTDKSQMDRMLSLCKTLSAFQPATDFHLEGEHGSKGNLTEENVPVMSKEPKSLVLKKVDVSSNVWYYLLQHESLEVLHLDSTPLPDAAVPLIFNHRNLKVLSLSWAEMSDEMCEYVCHHLGDLVHLEEIDPSFNDLSRVSSMRVSNTTSPVTLELRGTNMSPELLKNNSQVTSVMKLKEFDLQCNTRTEQLHHLLSEPHQELQSLEKLDMSRTKLNKNDIDVFGNV